MAFDPALAAMSAVELRELIASRKLSSVELMTSCIQQIERLNPKLNAIVTLAADQALDAARRADSALVRGDKAGPLHGLPVVIKDISETAGIRTTYASPLYRDNVPDSDCKAVSRLKSAGAIVLGKTNTPEFAAAAVSPRGDAALLRAAKALAMTAVELLTQPETMAQVQQEFAETIDFDAAWRKQRFFS